MEQQTCRGIVLTGQAASLLKFARATTDPDVAAGLLDKAADLTARSEDVPDLSPDAPYKYLIASQFSGFLAHRVGNRPTAA